MRYSSVEGISRFVVSSPVSGLMALKARGMMAFW